VALFVETATVAAAEHVGPALWLLHLDASQVAAHSRPGQFILVTCSDPEYPTYDPYLPRTYFVLAADRAAGRLSILVERRGHGSAWLCSRQPGDRLLVHGPAGRELRPLPPTRHLLLLADGAAAVASEAWLATEAARKGQSVTLVENVPSGRHDVPPRLLSPDVEYRACSPEAGGLLGALPSLIGWADEIVMAAAAEVLEVVTSLRRSRLDPFTLHAGVPIQAIPLLWIGNWTASTSTGTPGEVLGGGNFLPCGAGWCGACSVWTRTGRRLFCRDGPSFPLQDFRFTGNELPEENDGCP